ncbi:ABC transporter substrate-binding protein [Streptomyces cocklensis]|jgi:ABC-type branched-subunit amino acid transport system substrate-binding protein|uniref:ABC-type branched-chain amino acid transport system, substrate-binding protein n=1 Tax=Actinacidiphila cocklensis TaxID=887465 RepID=A0A9W4DWB0_9ACTN|nr:ABC transporter substrate-binding protein [Actinacidiphila cocklensis]MDD1057474.1 ABC transporter substrate-binding protein [Actinacidiphila cocklensis]WSX79001.1 ABC transporter substrate-binding protein [Streptomyces sp. NBC_00899]CAG6398820.1 ABC-type branched-chain amino acid transport system, substrate-binding protein [Actinacidiphila cocklensis]
MTERRVCRARQAVVPLLAAGALLSGCGVLPGSAGGSPGPVVVMTWAPEDTGATNMPGMIAMAQAFEHYVNDTGGLNGRKLKVLTCNEHNDSVAVSQCAQQAADAHAVAVVGSYSEEGGTFSTALESNDIAYLGGYGITQDEFQSPLSYPVNGGLPALLAGSGGQLSRLCKKVALVRPDTITGDQFPIFLDQGLTAAGRPVARDLPAQDDASDYTDVAQRAVGDNKASTCVSAVLGDHTSTFFDSLRRLGDTPPKVRLSSVIGSVQQSLVDATGGPHSPLENAVVTGWYPPASDPKWDEMKAVVEKYAFSDDRIDVADPGVQTTWIAYTVFSKVIRGMEKDTDVTADTVQRALDRTTKLSTGGLTPDLGWTDTDLLNIPDHARLVDSKVTYQVVRQGKLVQQGSGFVDVAATLRKASSFH